MDASKCLRAIFLASLAMTGCAHRDPNWPPVSQSELTSANIGYCTPVYQAQFGWPDPAKAAKVCKCESGGNPRAVSKSRRYVGLFQFSHATWNGVGGGDPFNPALNSEHAYRLYSRRGWQPWPVCGR